MQEKHTQGLPYQKQRNDEQSFGSSEVCIIWRSERWKNYKYDQDKQALFWNTMA